MSSQFMKNDSIIFDLDGTLWDATKATANGWNLAFYTLGINRSVTAKEIATVTGGTDVFQKLFPELSNNNSDLTNKVDLYEELAIKKEGGELFPHVAEIIPKLAEKYPLFIVSNCSEWYLEIFFKKSDLKKYFKDFDCFWRQKHNKSIMINALKEKYNLQKPVYVGDTALDQKAAQEAGIDFIFAAYGFGEPENPKTLMNSFQEITKLV